MTPLTCIQLAHMNPRTYKHTVYEDQDLYKPKTMFKSYWLDPNTLTAGPTLSAASSPLSHEKEKEREGEKRKNSAFLI